MYILTIARYDINHGEIGILLPFKALSSSICEDKYEEILNEDKEELLKDYEDMEYIESNFDYSYRIDFFDD